MADWGESRPGKPDKPGERRSAAGYDPEFARLFTDLATTSRLQTINEGLASGTTPRRDH